MITTQLSRRQPGRLRLAARWYRGPQITRRRRRRRGGRGEIRVLVRSLHGGPSRWVTGRRPSSGGLVIATRWQEAVGRELSIRIHAPGVQPIDARVWGVVARADGLDVAFIGMPRVCRRRWLGWLGRSGGQPARSGVICTPTHEGQHASIAGDGDER